MAIDEKYIRSGVKVRGEGRSWSLAHEHEDWLAHERSGDDVRELGESASGAARTLRAAGYELERGEAEAMERQDALAVGDQASAAQWRLARDVATGELTPVEAQDAQREYDSRQATYAEMSPEEWAELDGATNEITAARDWRQFDKMMAPDGIEQVYSPTLRSDRYPDQAEILRTACEEFGFDYWPPRERELEAQHQLELDGPSVGDDDD